MTKEFDMIIPDGLTTMLEGLSRAVLKKKPDNVNLFCLYYLTELRKFKDENPSFELKKLVIEFHKTKAESLPAGGFDWDESRRAGFDVIALGLSRLRTVPKEKPALPSQLISGTLDELTSDKLSTANQGDTVLSTHVTESGAQAIVRQDSDTPRTPLGIFVRHPFEQRPKRSNSSKQHSTCPSAQRKGVEIKQVGAAKKFTIDTQTSVPSDNLTVGDSPAHVAVIPRTDNKPTPNTPANKMTTAPSSKSTKETKESIPAERRRTTVNEGPRPPKGVSFINSSPRSSVRLRAAVTATGTEKISHSVKTQDPPTAKPRRVRIDAWTQVTEESSLMSTAMIRSAHKEKRSSLYAATSAHWKGCLDDESQREVFEASIETINDCNHDASWRGHCCRAQPDCACHHYSVSQDCSFHPVIQMTPTHRPGLQYQQYGCFVCQPHVTSCHCAVPPCVMARPRTTGRLKSQTQKSCSTASANMCNNHVVLTNRRRGPSTIMTNNYISPRTDTDGLPFQSSAIRYVPVYTPMDDHSLPRAMRPVQSAAYVPLGCVMDAEEERITHKRPCSAPHNRTAIRKPCGGGSHLPGSGYS